MTHGKSQTTAQSGSPAGRKQEWIARTVAEEQARLGLVPELPSLSQ